MHDYLGLVYGTAGNHEAHPANIFYPTSLGNETQWVYDVLTDEWSDWIGTNASQHARALGAYSTKYPKGNLRIISLNTNLYYRFNFIMYQKEMARDPNGQIAWLVAELDAAEKVGENVYIMGHMPFGEPDALPDASNFLDQVVKRYSKTIKAMFFGHTHLDHFEVSYADYAHRNFAGATAMSYICPSLTPTSGMPSFRVYDVDPDTFAVLDATTYMADMSDPAFQTTGPAWKKYYSAKEAYGALVDPPLTDKHAELTPAFWHNVTEAFAAKQESFDAYMARKSRGWKAAGSSECRDKCRADEICQLRAGRSQDNCYTPKPGVHFAKRSEPNEAHHARHGGAHGDCGVSGTAEILRALAARQDLLEMVQERFLAERAAVQPFTKRAETTAGGPTGTGTEAASSSTTDSGDCVPRSTSGGGSSNGATGSAAPSPSASTGAAAALVEPLGAMAMLAIGLVAV